MAFDLCVLTNEGISSIGLLKNRTHSISDVRVFLVMNKWDCSTVRSVTAESILAVFDADGCVELPCVYSVSQEVNISVTGSRPDDGEDAPSGYTVVAVATFVSDKTETNVALVGCVSDEPIIADERLKFTINLEETRDVFTVHADFDGTVVQGILQDNYYTKDEVDALVESSGSSDTDLSDYVTLDTSQTITGTKTFGSSVYVSSNSYFTSLDVTNTTSGKSTQLTSSSLNLSDNLSIRNSYGRVNEAYLNLMTLTASHDTSSNSLGGIDLSNASMSVFFMSSTVGTVYGKTTYNVPQDGSLSEMPEGFYGMGAEMRYFSVDPVAAELHASLDFYLPNPHKIYVHDPSNGSVSHYVPYVKESDGSSSSPYASLHDYISSLVSSSSSSSSVSLPDYLSLEPVAITRSNTEVGAVYQAASTDLYPQISGSSAINVHTMADIEGALANMGGDTFSSGISLYNGGDTQTTATYNSSTGLFSVVMEYTGPLNGGTYWCSEELYNLMNSASTSINQFSSSFWLNYSTVGVDSTPLSGYPTSYTASDGTVWYKTDTWYSYNDFGNGAFQGTPTGGSDTRWFTAFTGDMIGSGGEDPDNSMSEPTSENFYIGVEEEKFELFCRNRNTSGYVWDDKIFNSSPYDSEGMYARDYVYDSQQGSSSSTLTPAEFFNTYGSDPSVYNLLHGARYSLGLPDASEYSMTMSYDPSTGNTSGGSTFAFYQNSSGSVVEAPVQGLYDVYLQALSSAQYTSSNGASTAYGRVVIGTPTHMDTLTVTDGSVDIQTKSYGVFCVRNEDSSNFITISPTASEVDIYGSVYVRDSYSSNFVEVLPNASTPKVTVYGRLDVNSLYVNGTQITGNGSSSGSGSDNYVTLDTAQTISGTKTFTGDLIAGTSSGTLHALGSSYTKGLRLCDGLSYESSAYCSLTGYQSGTNGKLTMHFVNASSSVDYQLVFEGPNSSSSSTATLTTTPMSSGSWSLGSDTYKLGDIYSTNFHGLNSSLYGTGVGSIYFFKLSFSGSASSSIPRGTSLDNFSNYGVSVTSIVETLDDTASSGASSFTLNGTYVTLKTIKSGASSDYVPCLRIA